MNLAIYLAVVVIWGSTWIMLKLQVGVVQPEVSVAYRFMIAALLMFLWVRAIRISIRFTLKDHLFLALQGALIFCTNYALFYTAAQYLTSGLLAVVFSTASAFTVLLAALLERRAPEWIILVGSCTGVVGIAVIFWPELSGNANGQTAALGLVLSILGTISFSLGSLVSYRNQLQGLSIRGSMVWAMVYGVALLNLYILFSGGQYRFDASFSYVSSLLYLASMGSVVAFALYFTLLKRIGTARAAYATVLFPVVALLISTVFENYQWTLPSLIGLGLTLIGNVLVLKR